jgi:hypothetical protein
VQNAEIERLTVTQKRTWELNPYARVLHITCAYILYIYIYIYIYIYTLHISISTCYIVVYFLSFSSRYFTSEIDFFFFFLVNRTETSDQCNYSIRAWLARFSPTVKCSVWTITTALEGDSVATAPPKSKLVKPIRKKGGVELIFTHYCFTNLTTNLAMSFSSLIINFLIWSLIFLNESCYLSLSDWESINIKSPYIYIYIYIYILEKYYFGRNYSFLTTLQPENSWHLAWLHAHCTDFFIILHIEYNIMGFGGN